MLQTITVYNNVSKGILAKDKDLMAAFGTIDQKAVCLEILARGELQVWALGRRDRCHADDPHGQAGHMVMHG